MSTWHTNDVYNVAQGGVLTIPAPGVLGNDTDADGDTLSSTVIFDGLENGSISYNTNGSFTYTPNPTFTGIEDLDYQVSDANGGTDIGTITINVNPAPPNTDPVATNDVYNVAQGGTLTIPAPGVLGNDTDADGDTLSSTLIFDGLENGNISYPCRVAAVVPDGDGTITPMADVATHTAEAIEVLRRHGAEFGYLHGSRATDTARPTSDIDIAAHFGGLGPQAFEILLPSGVDLLVLDDAPLELAGRVAVRGRLLFETDPRARVVWEATTRKIYFDELPRISRAHREFAEAKRVVDEVRILRLLRRITDDLAILRRESAADEARRVDPMWLRGVKYTFITAIEACIDIAQHICSSEGWGPPADNGDAMRLIGAHNVLTADLADTLRKAVGFRNVLVHEYIQVSDDIVVSRLDDLGDIERFVEQVAAFISGPTAPQ